MPTNVESPKLGKEVERGVGQVVVDPPRQSLPSRLLVVEAVPHRGDDNTSHRTHMAVRVAPVPDVTGKVRLVGRTTITFGASLLHVVAEPIDLSRAIGGADNDPAECVLQGFEQLFAKPYSGSDRQFWVLGNIVESMHRGDIREEEVAHKETLGQARPAKVAEPVDASIRA